MSLSLAYLKVSVDHVNFILNEMFLNYARVEISFRDTFHLMSTTIPLSPTHPNHLSLDQTPMFFIFLIVPGFRPQIETLQCSPPSLRDPLRTQTPFLLCPERGIGSPCTSHFCEQVVKFAGNNQIIITNVYYVTPRPQTCRRGFELYCFRRRQQRQK